MGHLLWKWDIGQRMEPIVLDNFFQAAELSPNQETIHVYPNDFRISLDQWLLCVSYIPYFWMGVSIIIFLSLVYNCVLGLWEDTVCLICSQNFKSRGVILDEPHLHLDRIWVMRIWTSSLWLLRWSLWVVGGSKCILNVEETWIIQSQRTEKRKCRKRTCEKELGPLLAAPEPLAGNWHQLIRQVSEPLDP